MFSIIVLLLITAGLTLGQETDEARRNLDRCLNGLPSCDLSRLTPAEVTSVSAESKKRNFTKCMSRNATCDPSRLTKKESTTVQAEYRRQNVEKCLAAAPTCDPLQLEAADLPRI